MKKTILTLATIAIMGTSFQANALVGGVVAIAGGGVALAAAGLVTIPVSTIWALSCFDECYPGAKFAPLFLYLGFIALDGENGREIQFKEVPHSDLLKMNLTEDEAIAFNQNTEELSEAFKVVTSDLSKDSTTEDAKKLWDEQELILGTDAINGARKVLSFQMENNK